MPPFDQIRSVIAAWRAWRWKKLVGPIVEEIETLRQQRAEASKRHRKVSSFDDRMVALRTQQIKRELGL
ncbi:hypothetical protein [Labrys sp. ZIDIC5]|uniref:hypothetical protein n=1 Tax=Labrys sedimenti TaxID=3106036 RepID=UPI002AC9FB52|nr:hypothetical protein [Labrys sp. ZIDIC5]MDZ5448898.1 hypothetical protein [Labrys sp. ZIDIC5]